MTTGIRSEGEVVVARIELLDSSMVEMTVEDLSRSRTGIHGRVAIAWLSPETVYEESERRTLAWSYLNLDRNSDRVTLANSASQVLGRISPATSDDYNKEDLKQDLDKFAERAFMVWQKRFIPGYVKGNAEGSMVEFLLEPFVIREGGTIIFAPPGHGKSYTLLAMGVSIDAGISSVWPVKQARVLMVNLERSGISFQKRLGKVNRSLGVDPSRDLLILNARGKNLAEVYDALAAGVEQHRVDVLMLDSISRAGYGGLTEDVVGNKIIDQLNRLCPTWVALGHSPRADATHVFGSTMFEAGIDVGVQLKSQKKDERNWGVSLQIVKENDIGKRPPWIGSLRFNEDGLESVRAAKKGEFSTLDIEVASEAAKIRAFLSKAGKSGIKDIAQFLGSSETHVSRVLTASPMFLRIVDGDTALYGLKDFNDEPETTYIKPEKWLGEEL